MVSYISTHKFQYSSESEKEQNDEVQQHWLLMVDIVLFVRGLCGFCMDFQCKTKKCTFKIESKSHFDYLFGISKWSRIEPIEPTINFQSKHILSEFDHKSVYLLAKTHFIGNHKITLFIQMRYWKANKFYWWWCVPIVDFWWSSWWIFTRAHTHTNLEFQRNWLIVKTAFYVCINDDLFPMPRYMNVNKWEGEKSNVMSIFSQFNFINGMAYLALLLFAFFFPEIRLCSFYLVNKIRARARNNSYNHNNRVVYKKRLEYLFCFFFTFGSSRRWFASSSSSSRLRE